MQSPHCKLTDIKLNVIKRKQQTGKILIMKAIRLFKSTFILQYSDFGQHIVYAVNPFFKVTAAALQDKSLFTADAKGKLAEPGVAKMFSTVFFSLAFVCVGLDTRLKDIVSRENRNLLWAFLAAQTFNIVVTLLIALVLFGVLKPMLG